MASEAKARDAAIFWRWCAMFMATPAATPRTTTKRCDSPGSPLRFTMEANIFAVQVVFRSTHQRRSNVQESAAVNLDLSRDICRLISRRGNRHTGVRWERHPSNTKESPLFFPNQSLRAAAVPNDDSIGQDNQQLLDRPVLQPPLNLLLHPS